MAAFFTEEDLDKCIASAEEIALAVKLGEKHVEISSEDDVTCEVTCYFWQGKMYITDVKYNEGTKI